MPQLNFYVPEELAQRVRDQAAKEGKPVSRYLAELVKKEVSPGWPPGFFEEFLGRAPFDIEEPDDPPPQEREW